MSSLKQLIESSEKEVQKKQVNFTVKKETMFIQDVILHFGEFLPLKDLTNVKLVCSQWYVTLRQVKLSVTGLKINVWLPKALKFSYLFKNDLYFPSEFDCDDSLIYGANVFPNLEAVTLFLQCKFSVEALSYFFNKLKNLKYVKFNILLESIHKMKEMEYYKPVFKILSQKKELEGIKFVKETKEVLDVMKECGFMFCKCCNLFYLEKNKSECLYHPGVSIFQLKK